MHLHSDSGLPTQPGTKPDNSDRLEIPLQSHATRRLGTLLKVRRTNPLHVPHHIQDRRHHQTHSLRLNKPAALCCTSATGGTPGAPVEPLAENEPITASANPPLSHQDPEPEHHPNPEQPPLPNQHSHPHWPHSPRIPTGSPTQSPHSAPHSLPNPPKSTISAPASTASSSATTASSTAPSRHNL
ncbi:unnamed protein product [Microthlaspi erraticum]|uniref:Uncharacterized protein n=1 Tax=Microthlaspi erraticum TaxID=1685480 RepID=A0A6D2KT92_9BRAS|nr:unnamed protein product [Microthlaspi erraticum]